MRMGVHRHFLKKVRAAALGLLVIIMLMELSPVPAQAAETKTVRVGYVDAITYEEEYEDGYKTGAGYEYLQKIASVTGWQYEYVYGSFKECYDMLVSGEIDLFGDLTYTPERAELFYFSMYPQGHEIYCMYTTEEHEELAIGDVQGFNGCRIGVTSNSYQLELLETWLEENDIEAEIVPYTGYTALMEALDRGEVETIVTPDLSIAYGYVPLTDIGSSEYYFGVSKQRQDLVEELNRAQRELQRNEFDYNGALTRKYHSQTNSALKLSESEKQWLQDRGNVLRLGLLDNNLPYSTQAGDGSVSGILSVLSDTMERELGATVEETCYAGMAELLEAMERGEVDAIGPVYGDLYLAEQYNQVLTNGLVKTTPVVLYAKNNFDNDNAVIAVCNETLMTEDVVKILFPNATLYVCEDMEDCLNAVAAGKADSTLVSSVRLNTLRKYPAMEKLQFADLPLEAEVCLATTRANRMAASVLNKGIALSSASLNGSVLAQSSYVEQEVTVREFVRQNMALVLLLSGAVIVALSVMAALLYRNSRRLKAALEQAREANMAKTTFLSNMSHDIRTPMNAIVGLTHLAEEESDLSTIREYLDKIDSSSDFLLGLINDILDMSKIESGSLTLDPEPVTKKEFTESINTVIRPLMDSRRIHFDCRMDGGPECISVDRLRFQQIFLNLLSNAAKFTPVGGEVCMQMESLPAAEGMANLRFTIRDNGIGMSQDFLEHLYDPFSQEHSQLSGSVKGTGLGLPIVKSLVDAMGGTISVKSKLGEGTEFVVTICAPLAEPVAHKALQEQPGRNLQGANILLVEDNEINTYVAKLILEEVGCVVTTAENGQEALTQFESSAIGGIDAILMDVRMPVMNGIEATRAIRALSRADAKTVPIIAMTADAFAEEQKRTIDAGMNEHLSKPIDPPLLYAALEKYIHRSAQKSETQQ